MKIGPEAVRLEPREQSADQTVLEMDLHDPTGICPTREDRRLKRDGANRVLASPLGYFGSTPTRLRAHSSSARSFSCSSSSLPCLSCSSSSISARARLSLSSSDSPTTASAIALALLRWMPRRARRSAMRVSITWPMAPSCSRIISVFLTRASRTMSSGLCG
jgi:hypothetical protein